MSESRRDLTFTNWDDVVADLDQLVAGCTQNGKWDLQQTARHLNDWIVYPVDGFPTASLPIRMLMAAVRTTMGKGMLKKIVETGKMKDGAPTAPQTVYDSTGNASEIPATIDMLKNSITRFREHDGSIHPSPIFGEMDKQTAEQLQWVHFAHHLSWLSPNNTEVE